jgi:alanine racemase
VKKPASFPLVWAEVDLGRVRKNLNNLRRWIGKGPDILAVVKADAYGHGMKAVASALREEGIRFFGVATIDEARELRGVCPRARILVLGSFHAAHLADYLAHKIIPTVSSAEDARLAGRAAQKCRAVLPVHAKIDTGMGRLGAWHEEADAFFDILKQTPGIRVEGIYTHFSTADDGPRTSQQLGRFERAVASAAAGGLKPRFVHAANSLGVARSRGSHLNLVRPGIVLYGLNPSDRPLPFSIRPALSLKTRISFLKTVEKGRTISYGATFKASKKTTVATLPIGYSHGYRVGFSNRAWVLVGGRECPVIGRVTMDQILVDVSGVPGVRRWDQAVLIGRQKGKEVTASDLAAIAGTIPYEITCSVHPRIPRIYKEIG